MSEQAVKIPGNVPGGGEPYLLQKIAQGDRDAYAVLHRKYQAKIYQYIFRFTNESKIITEEVVQEIFINIWEKRAMLFTIQNFEAYLRKSAKNKLLNYLKHDEYKNRLHHSVNLRVNAAHTMVEENLLYNDYYKTALQAIQKLPEKRRLIFLLSTEEDLTLGEIAERLHISKSRVKQQLYSGTAFIKDYLRKNAEWLVAILGCCLYG